MKELYGLTKEQLIARCKKVESENGRLQDELDSLSECYSELEDKLADQINSLDAVEMIKDVDWFKYRLRLDDLLTPELESFIDDYLKFHNTVKG